MCVEMDGALAPPPPKKKEASEKCLGPVFSSLPPGGSWVALYLKYLVMHTG